jgi:large subunit ribosomal protein L32e
MTKFLRRDSKKYSKLGKKRKKKQIWRSPKGRDNKMREQIKGHPKTVSIGYGTNKNSRGKIKEQKPVLVKTIKELEKIKKNEIAIISNIGKKKKRELVEKAKEKGIKIHNINVEKFLKEINKELDKKNKLKKGNKK